MSFSSKKCRELIVKAKYAREALLWDEMLALVKEVVTTETWPEHLDQLMLAQRHAVNARRDAIRVLIAQREKAQEQRSKGEPSKYDPQAIDNYLTQKVCPELYQLCNDFVLIIDERFLAKLEYYEKAMRVFLLKTKADYYRYIAETKKALGTGNEDNPEIQSAFDLYQEAIYYADHLADNHPKRLGAYLNAAVFLYEVYDKHETAARMSLQACNRRPLGFLEVGRWNDDEVYLLLQLLRENATTWGHEIEMRKAEEAEKTKEFELGGGDGCYAASSDDDSEENGGERNNADGEDEKEKEGEWSTAESFITSTARLKSTSLEGNVSDSSGDIDEEEPVDIDIPKEPKKEGGGAAEGDTSQRD